MPNGGGMVKSTSSVALCASCDRCRARKTKCDGARPCGNCASKYMKKNKLTSIEGIDLSEFDCIYSPAKRRGPIPRGASSRKFSQSNMSQQSMQEQPSQNAEWPSAMQQMRPSGSNHQLQSNLFAQVMGQPQQQKNANFNGQNMMSNIPNNPDDLQQQINMLQQLQQQQQQQQQQSMNGMGFGGGMKQAEPQQQQQPGVPNTITNHTHLLEPTDAEGGRLHAYYKLSIDELFRLPPTPTDDEYCTRLNTPGMTPQMIPGSQLAALSASRFAEIALGALVHGEVSLGMELCNAVVHCLRESVQEAVQPPTMIIVSKAYFLLAVFRAFRGDMLRYFKYRRVSMTYLSKIEDTAETAALLSAITYQDSWAYMVHNGNERLVPSVDDSIPQIAPVMRQSYANQTELKFDVRTDAASIASNPQNKSWVQGAPALYLNNEAPLNARSLDALACSIRTCCDQANQRFATIAKEAGNASVGDMIPLDTINTATTNAVQSHENELCSRNMVLSAYTLMQQDENTSKNKRVNEGQQLVISAMDAFLENSDEDGNGGFSDSQIQSLLSVCNITVENPHLLHHAGPTYHIVTNAAILLCHLLNGMYSMKGTENFGAMELTMFEEVLDTFTAARKLLTIHRRKLPVKLRCHGIPRPGLDPPAEGQPFIDLGNTLLCPCRGCQGFVLMACSPVVAAERAQEARARMAEESAQEQEALELGEIDRELDIMGEEFNVDDDALLNMISGMITN
eukprot:CAMPEP_0172472554 /NCGR_PEP_ID=MMETSP1065-20121228/68400_1 /TAXON_ID=265537 /ORGANISM="Amphiprora paludosa, Strain CCMP125" /LENGTH=735 /DNA_ID=CAMNT_0013230701 /DNA_START=128 /DNA_END=2335 /DNA_ORIENTATION=+